jgi:hypothetical protein
VASRNYPERSLIIVWSGVVKIIRCVFTAG